MPVDPRTIAVAEEKKPVDSSAPAPKLAVPFKKRTVTFSQTIGAVTIRELEGCLCDGAVLIPGFPSVSLAPILTVGFLAEELKLPTIAVLTATQLSTKCVIEGSQPYFPVRLLGNQRVVVAQSESKLPPELTRDVARALLLFAERHHLKMVLCIEGMPGEEPDTSKMQFLSTSEDFLKKMQQLGHVAIQEGVIAGLTGVLLAEGTLLDPAETAGAQSAAAVELSCIIAPCPLYPDAKSTLSVLTLLKQVMPEVFSSLNTASLETKAQSLDSSVQSLLKQQQSYASAHTAMFS